MNKPHKIGSYEAICITTITIMNKIFFTSTAVTVQRTGTAAWYMTILSCLVSIAFFYIIYVLLKRFPGKNLPQINEIVLGKFLGKGLNLIFSAFTLYYTASALREFVEMIRTYNLPNTPISFILTTFILVICVVTYYGMAGLARVSALCFVPIVIGLSSLLLLAIPLYQPNLLRPILGYGLDKTALYGFLRSSAYIEILFITCYVGSLQGTKQIRKVGLTSLILSGLIFSVSIMAYIMAFGYKHGADNLSGLFALSRSIYYNRFIQRVESIFLFIWVLSSVITVAASFYFSIEIYSRAFKIKNPKPLLIPFSLITYAVCIMPKNMSEIIDINLVIIRQYSFVLYIPPLIILLIALITKKMGSEKNAKNN